MKRNVLILILTIVFVNCSDDAKSNKNIVNCINSYINKSEFTNKYYEGIRAYEDELISNKLLHDKTKDAYLLMLDNYKQNPKAFIILGNSDKYFNIVDFPSILHHFHYCVYEEVGKNKSSEYLRNLLSSIENMEVGEENIDLLKEYIRLVDFKEEELRLISCGYVKMVLFSESKTFLPPLARDSIAYPHK